MTEHYRLLARKITDNNYRCLVLRDPTNSDNEPQSIPTADGLFTDVEISKDDNDKLYNEFTDGILENVVSKWRLYGFLPPETKDVPPAPLDENSFGQFIDMTLSGVRFINPKRIKLVASDDMPDGKKLIGFELGSPENNGSASIDLKLFESIDTLWTGLDYSTNAELRNEVIGIVDAFCKSYEFEFTRRLEVVEVDENDQKQITIREVTVKENRGLVGPLALIQLYLDDRPLVDVARSDINDVGVPGPLALAALSGYVFEVEDLLTTGKPETLKITFNSNNSNKTSLLDNGNLDFVKQVGPPTVDQLPLAIDQEPEGIYLRVDWRSVAVERSVAVKNDLLPNWRQWVETGTINGDSNGKKLNDLSDHTILVRRSVGQAPVFGPDAHARSSLLAQVSQYADAPVNVIPDGDKSRLDDSKHTRAPLYFYVDRLKPDEFVGQLVHYEIEIRNVVDQTVARGQVSVRRRRLDPPPMPADVKAILVVNPEEDNKLEQSLKIEVELPQGLTDDVEPVVWYQTRPLDACGYFGTEDDMALEEGLRQADLNFEEDADTSEPIDWEGHPVSRYLRGAYDRHGLSELDTETNTSLSWSNISATNERAAVKSLEVDNKLLSQLCGISDKSQDLSGIRFYVALRRKENDRFEGRDTEHRSVESVLRPCEHFISVGKHQKQRIFQIEHIPELVSERLFIEKDGIALRYLSASSDSPNPDPNGEWINKSGEKLAPDPFRVQIQFSTLGVDGTSTGDGKVNLPGGFRVWLRDVVSNDELPFELVGSFETLSPEIYRYRPYLIDSSKDLSVRDVNQANDNPSSEIKGVSIDDIHRFFDSLSDEVRTWSGAPRIVRSTVNADTKTVENKDTDDQDKKKSYTGGPNLKDDQLSALLARLRLAEIKHNGQTADARLVNEDVREQKAQTTDQQLGDLLSRLGEDQSLRAVLRDWALLGPFVDWAYANGAARDLILPLGLRTVDDLEELRKNLKTFAEEFKTATEETGVRIAAFAVVPAGWEKTDQLMATVRICVLPATPNDEIKSNYFKLLDLALRDLAAEGPLHVFSESRGNTGFLPFDHSGICTVEWNGIKDLWRHQLECTVEQLDRYALVRAMVLSAPDSQSKPTTVLPEETETIEPKAPIERLASLNTNICPSKDLDKKYIQQFVVPRLMLPPPPPAIRRVADNKKVAFRIEDSQERKNAAQNLLARVRSGRITRIVSFDYMTDSCFKNFQSVQSGAADTQPTSPTVATSVEYVDPLPERTVWLHSGWSENDEDIVEVKSPLFFVKYRLSVRHRADRIDSSEHFSSAEAQCQPTIPADTFKQNLAGKYWIEIKNEHPAPARDVPDETELPALELPAPADGVNIEIPLVLLEDLLSNDQKREAEKHEATSKYLKFPDLESRYTIYYMKRDNAWITLGNISMPGYKEPQERLFTVSNSNAELSLSDPHLVKSENCWSLRLKISGFTDSFKLNKLKVHVTRGELAAELKKQEIRSGE